MHQQPITPYSMVEPVKATISDVISAINEDGVKTTIISPASIDERSAFEATASVETLAADAVQTAVSSNASGDLDRGTTPLSSTDGIGNSAMISAPSTPLIPSQNEADRGGSAISDLRKSGPSLYRTFGNLLLLQDLLVTNQRNPTDVKPAIGKLD